MKLKRLIALQFERLAHRFPRFHMMFLLSQRATRSMYTGASSVASSSDICKGNPSLEGQHPRGSCVNWRLPSRRGHLPAGHSVDGVVHEKDGDLFAAIGSMHDFCHDLSSTPLSALPAMQFYCSRVFVTKRCGRGFRAKLWSTP